MREETEKTNIWIALLNLENTFGSDETLDAAFTRAQEYVDKADLHERLATIFIETGKYDKAEDIFARMTKIKDLTATESFWLNYATFLMTTLNRPDAARALNQRALQSVDTSLHLHLTAKFAALEFRSPNGGAERGRTIFEGLLNTYPGKAELWDQFVDLEKAKGETRNVRGLFERMVAGKMKPRRAKYVFKRWVEFEEALGEKKHAEKVRRLAEEWVEKRRAVKVEGEE
jgi:rRNA biogenesis protein RRP5